MKYTKEDIKNSLLEAGIKDGDVVFFSTSLGMVGIPPKEVTRQEKLNTLFFSAIREILKNGTIIVPTYSYTFGKSTASTLASFTKTTPAEIGSFPNFVLKQKGVVRSIDPFVSVACLGKKCKELLSNLSNVSYGENSFFEKFVHIENSKCCSIGLGPNWTPFIHYADYLANVPHRYDKLFWGKIGSKLLPWIYSVRYNGDESYPYAHIAGREAEAVGIWRYVKLGRSRTYVADTKEYFDFIMKKLQNNKWYLAKGPVVDVVEKEFARVKYEDVGGEYITGQYYKDFLIPERWSYSDAKLVDQDGNIISTTPFTHSLSIEKEVMREELQKHIGHYQNNCFYNRDWGFVVKEKLKSKKYRVIIKSSFGKGKVKIKNNFAYLEEWIDLDKYQQSVKRLFAKGYFE